MELGLPNLNTEMFHDEFWNPTYFRVKMSKVKETNQKNIAVVSLHSCECWLLLVL